LEAIKLKGLNRIAKIGYAHLMPEEVSLFISFPMRWLPPWISDLHKNTNLLNIYQINCFEWFSCFRDKFEKCK
jgi:hypothetical protein